MIWIEEALTSSVADSIWFGFTRVESNQVELSSVR